MSRQQREMFAKLEDIIAAGYAVVGRHVEDEKARDMLYELRDDHVALLRRECSFVSAIDDAMLRIASRAERAEAGL